MKNKIPDFIKKQLRQSVGADSYQVIDTKKIFNINISDKTKLFINLEKVNNIRRINKFHEKVNYELKYDSVYVSCGETLDQRNQRIKHRFIFGFKNIFRIVDFFYKRLIPKIPFLKNFYFFITRGHNRVISKAEILGRLISCGFKVIDYFEYKNLFYVIAKKTEAPKFDMQPSYGPVFAMKRIGRGGKLIKIYKFRTMHPFSEYCQDLIIKENKLSNTGKINNDFRITAWGTILRKFWLDEIPNLYNLFKRDLKLIGVRPVSASYYNSFPKELKELRVKTKPACIGIHYCIIPKKKEDVPLIEIEYLKLYFKNPFTTDLKYIFYFLYNVFLKKVRSK